MYYWMINDKEKRAEPVRLSKNSYEVIMFGDKTEYDRQAIEKQGIRFQLIEEKVKFIVKKADRRAQLQAISFKCICELADDLLIRDTHYSDLIEEIMDREGCI